MSGNPRSDRRRAPRGMAVLLALALSAAAVPASGQAPRRPEDLGLKRAEDLFRSGEPARALALLDSLARGAHARRDGRVELAALVMKSGMLGLLGRPLESEPAARRAVPLAVSLQDSARLSRALRWLSASLGEQGRTGEAAAGWRRLLAIAGARDDEEHEGYARIGLGYIAAQAGRASEAREGYERAARIFRKLGNAYWQAWTLTALGRLEHERGDLHAARAYHVQAADVSRRGGIREYEAHARNNVGTLDYLQGDPAGAMAAFLEARRVQREIGQHHGALIAAHNVAIALRDLGRFGDASALLDSALAEARARGYADLEPSLLLELGELRREEGRWDESAELLRRALAPGEAVDPQDRMEAALSLAATLEARDSAAVGVAEVDRLGRSLWVRLPLETRAETHRIVGRWLFRAGRPRQALERLRRADQDAAAMGAHRLRIDPMLWMARCERRLQRPDRVRDWLDRAAALWEAERGTVRDPEWRERYGLLSRELMFERARIRLEDSAIASESARARAAFDALQPFKSRTLLERMKGPAGIAMAAASAGVADARSLQAVLEEGELYLEWAEGAEGLLVVAITRDAARGAVIEVESGDFRGRLARFVELASIPPDPRTMEGERRALAVAARRLGRELMQPVSELAASARRIILVPDGVLCRVPVAALGLADSRDGGLLSGNAAVSWTPSAAVLIGARRNRAPARGTSLLAVHGSSPDRGPLPGARDEALWLARTFRGAECRAGASLAGASRLGSYSILHFAAHSEIDAEHPWRSGIRLAPGDSAGEPAWLRAAEIASTRLSARLAVLAGCESAGGQVVSGEGVIGLAAAFLSAGVPTVVASLWPVEDRATERLMKRFYAALSHGRTAAEALHEAQMAVRSERAWSHPFYWAGFVLIGDPGAVIPLERRGWRERWILLASLGLVMALGVLRMVRARSHVRPTVTTGAKPPLT